MKVRDFSEQEMKDGGWQGGPQSSGHSPVAAEMTKPFTQTATMQIRINKVLYVFLY